MSAYADSLFDTLIYRSLSRSPMQFPLREKIAGEIALSEQPGKTMRKWRAGGGSSETEPGHQKRVGPRAGREQGTGGPPPPRQKNDHTVRDPRTPRAPTEGERGSRH